MEMMASPGVEKGVTLLGDEAALDCYNQTYHIGKYPGGGTFIGHSIPGFVFACWGLWWAFQISLGHLRGRTAAQGWYRASGWLALIEPVLKAFVVPVGPLVELYLDHSYFLPLYCPDGSFVERFTHNYQHASSYLGFMLSGLVDFLGMFVKLPPGTQQAFLGLSFFVEGFLMIMHKKHEPFDLGVHWLLGTTMWATAGFVWLQLQHPHALWPGLGRAGSVLMQGMWLWQIGNFMFTGAPQWKPSAEPPVPASLMMMPVVFGMLLLVNAVVLLVVWLLCQWYTDRHQQPYLKLPQVRQDLGGASPVGSADLDGHSFTLGGNDSAQEQSDGSEGVVTPPKPRTQAPGVARQQLRNALQILRPGGARPDKHES